MGKGKNKTHNGNRESLLKTKNLDKESLLQCELIDNDKITGEQINLFNAAVYEFPQITVENPIFIINNLELMKSRLEFYKLSMKDFIDKNDDSVTENMSTILTKNKYINYVQTMIDSVKN